MRYSEDALVACVAEYVRVNLGPEFVNVASASMEEVYQYVSTALVLSHQRSTPLT